MPLAGEASILTPVMPKAERPLRGGRYPKHKSGRIQIRPYGQPVMLPRADHGRPLRFAGAADAKATGREDVQLQLTHDLTER